MDMNESFLSLTSNSVKISMGTVKNLMKKEKQNMKPQNLTTPCTRVATRNRWAQAESTEKKSFKYSKNSVNSVVTTSPNLEI